MKEEELFAKLSWVLDTLIGPEGCPWDQKQTLRTLRQSVLEETCELIDTIEEKDSKKMNEELGDLLLNVVFLGKVAAKEGHFTLTDTFNTLIDKLIYRHPHVFGDSKKLSNVDELMQQWDELKKKEREKTNEKSMLDSIPKTLPALSRAQKLISKMKRSKIADSVEDHPIDWESPELTEEEVGRWIFEQVRKAESKGLDAELGLRRYAAKKEKAIRAWEAQSCS